MQQYIETTTEASGEHLDGEQPKRRLWIGIAAAVVVALGLGTFLTVRLMRSDVAKPGWEGFSGDGFALYLPERFEGGDPEEVIEALRASGPTGDQMADSLEAFPSALAFVAYDAEDGSATPATVNLVRVPSFGATLEQLSLGYADQLETTGVEVSEQSLVTIAGKAALRVMSEGRLTGFRAAPTLGNVQYVFAADGAFSILTFTAAPSDFDVFLPEFEESARTFAHGLGEER